MAQQCGTSVDCAWSCPGCPEPKPNGVGVMEVDTEEIRTIDGRPIRKVETVKRVPAPALDVRGEDEGWGQ